MKVCILRIITKNVNTANIIYKYKNSCTEFKKNLIFCLNVLFKLNFIIILVELNTFFCDILIINLCYIRWTIHVLYHMNI